MTQFCKCGSLVVNGKCSNKSCNEIFETTKAKAPNNKTKNSSSSKAAPKQSKSTRTRRASKVVTYSLEELEKKENVKY